MAGKYVGNVYVPRNESSHGARDGSTPEEYALGFADNAEILNSVQKDESPIVGEINLSVSENWLVDQGIGGNGDLYPSVSGWVLGKFPVEGGNTYSLNHEDGVWSAGDVGAMAFYDKNNVEILHFDMFSLEDGTSYRSKKFTVPENCAWVYTNVVVLSRDYRTTMSFRLGESADLMNRTDRFIDKKVVLFGDSITEQWRTTSAYGEILKNVRFKEIRNYARSGWMYTHQAGTVYDVSAWPSPPNNVIWNEINKLIADGDYIPDVAVFLAGTNDYDKALGDPSTAFGYGTQSTNPADKTDISLALRFCIDTLIEAFPAIDIVICTPIPFINFMNKIRPVAETLTQCANLAGIPVIDQLNESGIFPARENILRYHMASDGVHPSDIGQQLLGRFLGNRLYDRLG